MQGARRTVVVCRLMLVVVATMWVACGRIGFETQRDAGVDANTFDANTFDATGEGGQEGGTGSDAASDAQTADATDDAALDASADAAPDAQTPFCTWSEPEEITGLDATGELWGPSLSRDARTLYFALREGRNEHIMVATRPDRGAAFSAATTLPGVNSSADDGTPHISADDRTLYFFSTRPNGVGGRDLWYATRPSANDSFGPAALLLNINSTDTEYAPRVSDDELTLWVTSGRAGSGGAMDIWIATRANRTEDFSAPTNSSELNSPAFEAAPTFSSDGLFVVFASDRQASRQLDLWTATRTDTTEPFGAPESISVANTADNEADPILSTDDTELFYSSNRDGSRKLWRLRRLCD